MTARWKIGIWPLKLRPTNKCSSAEKAKDSDDIDYAKSVSGALCLVPEGEAFDSLHKDYIQMIEAGLFHSKPAPFEDLVTRLRDLEHRANNLVG